MGSGKIINDEGLKTEALSGPKIYFGVSGSLLNSEIFNFCYLFPPKLQISSCACPPTDPLKQSDR